MKEYVKPTLEISSLIPDRDITSKFGNELIESAPGNWAVNNIFDESFGED